MPSEHFSDYKTSLAQKPLLDYKCSEGIVNKITVWWIYSNTYFVKKLKKPQISSKSHAMTCLRRKQSMNSLLGVKIAQNPYFWFGYNSQKWRKITHWTCFSTTPKKVDENFSIQLKIDSVSKRKNLRESVETNFYNQFFTENRTYWICLARRSTSL